MLGRYVRKARRRNKILLFITIIVILAATTVILLKMDEVGFISLEEIWSSIKFGLLFIIFRNLFYTLEKTDR
ncbi:MAG: hypothetical protein J6J36_01515 [Clostridia bacterium]|nr:hypothetical protein [Clostridia bacterium]